MPPVPRSTKGRSCSVLRSVVTLPRLRFCTHFSSVTWDAGLTCRGIYEGRVRKKRRHGDAGGGVRPVVWSSDTAGVIPSATRRAVRAPVPRPGAGGCYAHRHRCARLGGPSCGWGRPAAPCPQAGTSKIARFGAAGGAVIRLLAAAGQCARMAILRSLSRTQWASTDESFDLVERRAGLCRALRSGQERARRILYLRIGEGLARARSPSASGSLRCKFPA